MKNNLKYTLFIIALFSVANTFGQVPAFPGAEGGGKYTTGGRGGFVYEVSNLNDTGPGSLRDAISQENRTIVFKISGIIQLKSKLVLRKNNITIAGQTAPGDGICIAGYPVNISASNIIIRYLRFRMGDSNKVEDDAINCFSGAYTNIIIDHCSMSWAIDETASFYDIKNFTLQWSFISESLYKSFHSKGIHGYGGIWGGENASYLHNFIAHHSSRTPRFQGTRYNSQKYRDSVEFCNNVIFNWGNTNSVYGGEGGAYNMINNYYKPGSATPGSTTTSGSSNKRNRIIQYSSFYVDKGDTIFGGRFYVNGNYMHGYPDVTMDNWTKGVQKDSYSGASLLIQQNKMSIPFAISDYQVEDAESAYLAIIKHGGASLPKRDAIDERLMEELQSGVSTYEGAGYKSVNGTGITHPSGIIDSQNDVGSYPGYNALPAPIDSDKDGMPDDWELANALNPNNAEDRNQLNNQNYTMLEVYLNALTNALVSATTQQDALNENEVYLLPSIGTDVLTLTNVNGATIHDIIIRSIVGEVVKHSKTHLNAGKNQEIDISDLKSGTYIMTMKIGPNIKSIKFLKI